MSQQTPSTRFAVWQLILRRKHSETIPEISQSRSVPRAQRSGQRDLEYISPEILAVLWTKKMLRGARIDKWLRREDGKPIRIVDIHDGTDTWTLTYRTISTMLSQTMEVAAPAPGLVECAKQLERLRQSAEKRRADRLARAS
jgi:hypothetical protein